MPDAQVPFLVSSLKTGFAIQLVRQMPGRSTKPYSVTASDRLEAVHLLVSFSKLAEWRFLLLQPGFFVRGAVTGGRFAQVIHSGGCACRGNLLLVCCKQLMSEKSELAPPSVGILLYVHSGKNTEASAHKWERD